MIAAKPTTAAKLDARAKKILFDAHWTSKGWIDRQDRTSVPAADRAHAVAHRMMFDPFDGTHDVVVARTVAAVKQIPLARATAAFLASLSSRRLDLRSGLASYVIAAKDAPHPFAPGDDGTCGVCFNDKRYDEEDLDVLSFERHKWGGVRHHSPIYRLLDLEQLALEPPVAPTKDDLAILHAILAAVHASAAKDSPGKLSARLKDVLASTKDERNTLIDTLAAADVLVAKKDRGGRGEWSFVGDWRGEDGVNAPRVRELFGMHGVKVPR